MSSKAATYEGKPCVKCGGVKRCHRDGDCTACADRSVQAWVRRQRAQNPDRARDKYCRRTYGITKDQSDLLFVAQGSCCAICKTTETGALYWNIDHDHGTGEVRGILCNGCNRGLGFFNDSPAKLRNAIEYLVGEKQGAARFLMRELQFAVPQENK